MKRTSEDAAALEVALTQEIDKTTLELKKVEVLYDEDNRVDVALVAIDFPLEMKPAARLISMKNLSKDIDVMKTNRVLFHGTYRDAHPVFLIELI